MSAAIEIDPLRFQDHAARTATRSLEDLYVQAWLDDQAALLLDAAVTFFRIETSPSGELVMQVFGSGFLVERRNRVQAVTAVIVAEQLGRGETFMQTSVGAVSVKRQLWRFDRGQGVAVCDVDKTVRSNAVLPSAVVASADPAGSRGANSLLCVGFPGTANASRKSRRPNALEAKAVMVPYCTGNHVRTYVQQALILEWAQRTEIGGHGRSISNADFDPKGMIGGPVFEVKRSETGELSSRLLAIMVEHRRDQGIVIAARTSTIDPFLDRAINPGA